MIKNNIKTVLCVIFILLISSQAFANNLPAQSQELVFIETSAFDVGIDNDPLWNGTKRKALTG